MAGIGSHRNLSNYGGLAESLSETENEFCLNIKFSDSQSFNLSVKSNQTVRQIKERVCQKAGLPSSSINLIFAGELLKNDKTVEDYGFGGHTTLHAFSWSDDGLGCLDTPTLSSTSSPEGSKDDYHYYQTVSPRSRNATDSMGLSRFFVFCKLCSCVRPGLLRVVCRSCGSGLFVVNHGPSCWNDISSNTSLKGRCKNGSCSSDTPRFYLRCSQRHQGDTEGTAAALCHVQLNHKRIECIACQDIGSHVLIFPCPPGHVMCLDCFRQYAIANLEGRQFVEHETHGYTLPCPAGCENAFIEDSHHFLLMGVDKYERFKNFGAEEFVLKNGGVLCPAPNCGAGIFPDDDDHLIKCSECKFESCRDCKRAYHFDSCQESLLSEIHNMSDLPVDHDRAAHASWECQSLSLIESITKACPGCSTNTERDGGCMHIMCTRCGAEWCWLCAKPWDRECQAQHWFG